MQKPTIFAFKSLISLTVIACFGLSCFGLAGCAPRGETHTLDEVLGTARSEYANGVRAANVEALKGTLTELSRSLEGMATANGSATQITGESVKVADVLANLVKTAGYTSRPSMGEIIMQHRILGVDAGKGDVNPARVKLLVARTYSLMASELQTTKFSVLPIEKAA